MMGVYLLHIEPRLHHAGHYLGHYDDQNAGSLARRLYQHERGRGAKFTQAVVKAGHFIECVRVWPGLSRRDERRLKRRKNAPRLCPICNQRVKVPPPPVGLLYGGYDERA